LLYTILTSCQDQKHFSSYNPKLPDGIADSYLKTKLLLSTAQMKAALETSSDVQKKQPYSLDRFGLRRWKIKNFRLKKVL